MLISGKQISNQHNLVTHAVPTSKGNILGGLHGDHADGDSDNIDDGEENLGYD